MAEGFSRHALRAAALDLPASRGGAGSQRRRGEDGPGSGGLAVASVKLGAAEAHCFDIDPQALIATRDNAESNGVTDRVLLHHSADELPGEVDVLLSNILSGPLCELAPHFAALVRPGGDLVLGGLREHEVSDVTRAFDAWFDIRPFGQREGCVGLSGRRHEATD